VPAIPASADPVDALRLVSGLQGASVRGDALVDLASLAGVELRANEDKYALNDLPEIDCDARLPLCHARCCRLSFALTPQDVEEGVVRWAADRPYRIAHTPGGCCVHQAGERGCEIYEHRPGVCRRYDCRQDARIWIDYDRRIPVPE
jgi:hypothetical protein